MYQHPPHWDNVTAPHGRRKLSSPLHFRQQQEGETTKSIGGIGKQVSIATCFSPQGIPDDALRAETCRNSQLIQ
jgi:hypothetical protein